MLRLRQWIVLTLVTVAASGAAAQTTSDLTRAIPDLTAETAREAGFEYVSYSKFRRFMDSGLIEQARINRNGYHTYFIDKSEGKYFANTPNAQDLADRLVDAGAEVEFYLFFGPSSAPDYDVDDDEPPFWLSAILSLTPLVIFIALLYWLVRWQNGHMKQVSTINDEARRINHEFIERLDEVLTRHRNG